MTPTTGIPFSVKTDPIIDLLLKGEAESVHEAEELYLDRSIDEIIRLAQSPLSEEEFRSHPLIVLLMAHGSRGKEDSLW